MNGPAAIERCRYGRTALWTARGALGGSAAGRFARGVDLHFRSDGGELLVDVRGLGRIDSCGIAALERCRSRHRGFRVVGRPLAWADLPLRLRLSFEALGADRDLDSALGTAAGAPGPDLREHRRIPVGIAVEVLHDGATIPATLADLSRGGMRLERLPPRFCAEIVAAHRRIDVFGLAADPLAREVLGIASRDPVPAIPVHLLAGGGVGVRYAEGRPPV